MKEKPKRIGQLLVTFLKIGAFTFGGGYAMIPLIEKETVEKHGWITHEELLEIVAIAESTPGPIAVNTATFVGKRTAGFWGAACATFGVVFPSFIIILIISGILEVFGSVKAVQYAFRGIQAGVLALILKALWSMYQKCPKGLVAYIVMAGAFVCTAIFNLPVVWVLVGCALFGLITSLLAQRREAK